MSGQAPSVRYDLTVSVIDGGNRVEAVLPHTDGTCFQLGFVTRDGFNDPNFAHRLKATLYSLIESKRAADEKPPISVVEMS